MTFKQRLEAREKAKQIPGEEHPSKGNSQHRDPMVGVGWCTKASQGASLLGRRGVQLGTLGGLRPASRGIGVESRGWTGVPQKWERVGYKDQRPSRANMQPHTSLPANQLTLPSPSLCSLSLGGSSCTHPPHPPVSDSLLSVPERGR